MKTFMKAKLNRLDEQTNIDKYVVTARIIVYEYLDKSLCEYVV